MKKRKTDLFRFITLRSPETITKERKAIGFVFPPSNSTAIFLSDLDYESGDIDSADLLTRTETFTAFEKVSEVKDSYPVLYKFSQWLLKNKNTLTVEEVYMNLPGAGYSALTTSEINELWNNILYDILQNKNPYVRQICIQLLIAEYFIGTYDTYSEVDDHDSYMRRLANAKIVIPKPYSKVKQIPTETLPIYQIGKRQFGKLHEAKIAQLKIKELEALMTDFVVFENQYNQDHEDTHQSNRSNYSDAVELAINDRYTDQPEKLMESSIENEIPDNLVPRFSFDFVKPFDSEYTSSNSLYTSKLASYIASNNLIKQSLETAKAKIEDDLTRQKQIAAQAITRKHSAISINGGSFNPKTSGYHDFALSIERNDSGHNKYYFSIDARYDNAAIVDYHFKLTQDDNPIVSAPPIYMDNKDTILFLELFPEALLAFSDYGDLIFEGWLILDDGKKLKFYKKTNSIQPILTGVAVTATLSDDDVTLYGVNRIGIADFRKVEQEVCCYIPGEVSHIENVLAKEYKEKTTRSLTRSEDTTEFESQSEAEHLSDTTSTSRHEMNNEIAQVLDEDRQINTGFNATTSGKIGKFCFDASGYADFSTGHSSSESNSTSKTYAEDLTRRALERLVQKTTIKRTSKILREFEESNKHGFDNREGEHHVTGVYRWIDKVYKNRLVNYGKRLIYEFMVPEPARFYKEAIIQKADEEVHTSTDVSIGGGKIAVKPTALKDNGINSAKDITRENYERLAALYGVGTFAPKEEFTTISAAYSESIGSGDSSHSFSYPGLVVPDEYGLILAKGKVSYKYKSRVDPKATINTTIGDKNLHVTCGKGSGDDYRMLSFGYNSLTGEIPIAINTQKIVSFSVSVELKCKLKSSVFDQWQQDLFSDLTRAYELQLQLYNDATATASTPDTGESRSNELEFSVSAHKEIVKTELKRLCIEMLTRPYGIQQGKDFYIPGACDVPALRLSRNLDFYANNVKFFEHAFDWDLMAENFYPYYWAKRCDWKELIQSTDASDSYFQSFLQSGMSRVIVPVKPGFEDAVTFFMETGCVWTGTGMVLWTDDEIYLSIADELNHIEGEVEGAEWETIVPTALTIVQKESVLLDEGGLPCCNEEEVEDLNLNADTTTLTRLSGTTE